jgi:hypothetical protein
MRGMKTNKKARRRVFLAFPYPFMFFIPALNLAPFLCEYRHFGERYIEPYKNL